MILLLLIIFGIVQKYFLNKQVALLTCTLYSIVAFGTVKSIYLLPRFQAVVSFFIVLLLFFHFRPNNLRPVSVIIFLIIILFIYMTMVHQVSVWLGLGLILLLLICEFINNEKYMRKSLILLLFLIPFSYWIYIGFTYADNLVFIFFNQKNIEEIRLINANNHYTKCRFLSFFRI